MFSSAFCIVEKGSLNQLEHLLPNQLSKRCIDKNVSFDCIWFSQVELHSLGEKELAQLVLDREPAELDVIVLVDERIKTRLEMTWVDEEGTEQDAKEADRHEECLLSFGLRDDVCAQIAIVPQVHQALHSIKQLGHLSNGKAAIDLTSQYFVVDQEQHASNEDFRACLTRVLQKTQ